MAALVPCAAQGLPDGVAPLTATQRRDLLAGIDAVGRRGFLYAVGRTVDPGGPTLYLYGTIHLGRVGGEPFNAPLMTALRQSRRLAIEADPTDDVKTRTLAMRLGRYADGDGLQRHLPPALMARVRAFGERNGMSVERVSRFKPWLLTTMVSLNVMNGAGLDPALGSELYLSGYARSVRMPIVEIEGVEAQLTMLASLPEAMQTAQLDEALSDVDSRDAEREGQALFDLWLAGDAAAADALIAQMHRDAEGRRFERYFFDVLIDRRNRTMADRAEGLLREAGDTFFAIGALHLFGEAGLIREFERRGYRVVDLQAPLMTRR